MVGEMTIAEMIEEAYREGFCDGTGCDRCSIEADDAWRNSFALESADEHRASVAIRMSAGVANLPGLLDPIAPTHVDVAEGRESGPGPLPRKSPPW